MIAQAPKFDSDRVRWYTHDGKSINDVEGANGNIRPPTLRDARKWNYIPSVTSIISLLAKPAVEKWKMERVAEAAWKSHYEDLEGAKPMNEWIDGVLHYANETMDAVRDKGTDVHGEIDRWLKADCPEPDSPHLEAARSALKQIRVYGQPFRVERTFAVKMGDIWVAGKTDLVFDNLCIVDWKIVDRLNKKKDWMERQIQLGSYSAALFGGIRPCYNVFIDQQTAEFEVRTWTVNELDQGYLIYTHLYRAWCAIKGYNPSHIAPSPGAP